MRLGTSLLYTALFMPFFAWASKNQIYNPELDFVSEYILTFFLAELTFYCTHRFSHVHPLGWASHATHHTLTKLNLTNGGRSEITSPFSLYYFAATPWLFLGVNPIYFATHINTILLWQLIVHTEHVPKIGYLDVFLNTPSNHRVHHGIQDLYKFKNFGGITVLFDQLFGTYQAEIPTEKPIYGISGGVPSQNPFRLAFIGWERWLRSWLEKKTKTS